MLKKSGACLLAALLLAPAAVPAEAALLVSNRPTAVSADAAQTRAEAALKSQAENRAAEVKAAEIKNNEAKAEATAAKPEVKAEVSKPVVKTVPAPTISKPEVKIEAVKQTTAPTAVKPVVRVEAAKPEVKTVSVPTAVKPAVKPVTVPAAVKPSVSSRTVKKASEGDEELKTATTRSKEPLARKAAQYKSVYTVGDYGWKIREAKKKLQALDYDMKDTDGNFTKDLQKQLKKFQKKHNLKSDGKLNQATYDALNRELFSHNGINNITGYEICQIASKYRGVPYVFGGTTPRGFDCSGYVQYVFRQKGASLTRTADTQALEGVAVSKTKLKPGDLVFFTTYEPGASHVGIYAGNNQFWNATSSRGVMLSDLYDSYWGSRYYGARRILVKNDQGK